MSQLFSGIQPLARGLDYHLNRHNVLASNVANVDTPGFKPLELVRETEPALDGKLPLKTTDMRHYGAPEHPDQALVKTRVEQVIQPGADGNAVSLEREMGKIAANDLRYDSITTAVRQQLGLLSYAVSGGSRG
ncbi:MAG: flagellar basal body rod protein FlgB [Polyangiales bacterium]